MSGKKDRPAPGLARPRAGGGRGGGKLRPTAGGEGGAGASVVWQCKTADGGGQATSLEFRRVLFRLMILKIEKLPRTITGKIDRRGLAIERARAERAREEAYVAPQGREEEAVAAIFADVLKLQRVGRQESIFDLGGHSL